MEAFIIGNRGARNNNNNGNNENVSITPVEEVVLYESSDISGFTINTSTQNTITLSKSYKNFETIRIEWGYSVNNSYIGMSNEYTADFLEQINVLSNSGTWSTLTEIYMGSYNTNGISFILTSDTELRITNIYKTTNSNVFYIRRIIGTTGGEITSDAGYHIDKILSLSSGTVVNTLYTFIDNHNLEEYNELCIVSSTEGDVTNSSLYEHHILNIKALKDSNYSPFLITSYFKRSLVCTFSDTTLKVTASTVENENNIYIQKIYQVYGIKYNSIESNNTENNNTGNNNTENCGIAKIELFSATNDLNTEASRTTYNLSNDYDNYDYLEFSVWRNYRGISSRQSPVDELTFTFSIDQLNEVYNNYSPEKCLLIHFWQVDAEWLRLKFDGKNKLIISDNGSGKKHLAISKIYGIKLNVAINNTNSIGINYSITEQNTGTRWVNGKPIYQITLGDGTTNLTGDINISNLNIETFVSCEAIGSDNDNYTGPLWVLSNISDSNGKLISVNNNGTILKIYGSYYVWYITIRYTKTTDSVVTS